MSLILALLSVAFVAFWSTKLLFPNLYSDLGFAGFPSRMLLGMALTVCGMNGFLYVLPGKSSAWVLIASMLVLALIAWHRGTGLFASSKKLRAILPGILALTLLLAVWRLWSAARIGALVPFEGTGNHDEFWYIFVAEWLLEHDLRETFQTNEWFPLAASAATNIGTLPRIGSESLIALIAGLSGASIAQAFVAVSVVGAVLMFYAATLGLAEEEYRSPVRLYLTLFIAAISPVSLFIYGNINLATSFGVAFLGGYYYFMRRAMSGGQNSKEYLPAGVFLAALLATYPELLAVAVPASIVVAVQVMARRNPGNVFHISRATFGILAVSLASAPMAVATLFQVMETAGAAVQGDNLFHAELFTRMSIFEFPLTVLTFDVNFVEAKLGNVGVSLSSFVLLMALVFAPGSVWRRSLGLVVGCLIVLFVFWFKDYGYGGMKAIEFLALPSATLFSAGVVRLVFLSRDGRRVGAGSFDDISPPEKKEISVVRALPDALRRIFLIRLATLRVRGFSGYALGISALVVWGWVTVAYFVSFDRVAQAKHLHKSVADLERARSVFKPGDVLYITDDLGEYPFMVSRWIAYIFRDIPLIYAPLLQGGGYIYNLDRDFSNKSLSITHILRKRHDENTITSDSVFANDGYEILAGSQLAVVGSGFHGAEGGRRWMGQEGEIIVLGQCAKALRIVVLERFGGATGESAIEVSSQGGPKLRFDFPGGKGSVSYPLQNTARQVLKFSSLAVAKSPKEVGMSLDTRPLTFSFGKYEIEKIEGCR